MHISPELTDSVIAQILGERIARHRINADLTQAELAERSGIGKRTLERIEAGSGTELVNFIRVLRALDVLGGFEVLIPELPPSPIQQLKLRGKQRRRVSHPRGQTNAQRAVSKPWTWGVPGPKGILPAKRPRSTKL